MGYTHYWHRKKQLPARKFQAAVKDCQKLCEALQIPLGDGHGEGKPIFEKTGLFLNGHVKSGELCSAAKASVGLVWPSSKADGIAVVGSPDPQVGQWCAGEVVDSRCLPEDGDGSYESFVVEKDREPSEWETPENGKYFECCKTNYRPYDLVVQCCLIALNHHLSGDNFDVTSDGEYEQWKEAVSACQQIVGYGLLFEFK